LVADRVTQKGETVLIEPRPLPPETIDGLRPPRAGFPYFAHADHFLFDAAARDYSAANAWWLADACLLAYGAAAFVEKAFAQSPLPGQSWRLDWLGTSAENRGLALSHAEAIVVVFRGTRLEVRAPIDAAEVVLINQDDLWTDSQFLPAVCRMGGRVHSGFAKAFAEVASDFDNIVQARRPGQRLWLAGHSLGGALATLAAAHVGPDGVHGLYTYGCPRVGDAAFAAALPADCHYRFVSGDDWVTTVPPELLGYVHAGTLQQLRGGPARRFWNDLASAAGDLASVLRMMTKDLRLNMGELPLKIAGLADHAPIYYATLLWNALLASEEGGKRGSARIAR
jgi:triacylglycerol lipase